MSRFAPPSPDEQFYVRAIQVLSRARRRAGIVRTVADWLWYGFVTAILCWLTYQVLHRPYPIVDRWQAIATPAVRAGDEIKVHYRLRRLQACPTDVSWTEIDGAKEVHRFGPVHVPYGGDPGTDDFVHGYASAAGATPGPSSLRVTLEFACPGNYSEALSPLVETLPEIRYETLPRAGAAIEPAPRGPP